jgi:hypothetical protein
MAYGSELETDVPVRQRTVGIWVIVAYIGFSVAITPYTIYSTMRVYPNARVPYLLTAISLALNVAGAVALFKLKASALRLFVMAFAVVMLSTVYMLTVLDPHVDMPVGMDEVLFRSVMRATQIFAVSLTVGIYLAIILYLVRLKRRGVLR